MAFSVTSAKVDITPTAGGNPYLGGYGGSSPRTAQGTHSTLYARCLVLWDGNYPNVIVSLDVLAISRPVHQAIRAAVLPLNSLWSTSDFVLSATHTHNGPVLTEELDPYISYGLTNLSQVTSYVNTLKSKVVTVVQTALAATKVPCTVDYSVTTQDFATNRAGLPYQETAVPLLVCRSTTGQRKAVLFSYGCHPVAAGVQTQWDGDYPAAACSTIEAAIPGCFAIYVAGPAGDQDPVGARSWSLSDSLGEQLGDEVVSATSTAGRTLTGPIMTSLEDADLPLDVTDTPQNRAALVTVFQARQNNPGLPAWYHRHGEKMIDEIDEGGPLVDTVPLPIQVWKLQGDPMLRMAFVGGELVSGYAVYFRNLYGGDDGLMVSAFANETPGYVPSNELLPPLRTGGSYEGGWDTDYPGVAGGSMTVYGCIGHFKAGTGGVEDTLTDALDSQLS